MRSVVAAHGRTAIKPYVPEARLRTGTPHKADHDVGADIRRVRLSLGLTLHDVAAATGYSLPLLGRLESTSTAPSEHATARILRALLAGT